MAGKRTNLRSHLRRKTMRNEIDNYEKKQMPHLWLWILFLILMCGIAIVLLIFLFALILNQGTSIFLINAGFKNMTNAILGFLALIAACLNFIAGYHHWRGQTMIKRMNTLKTAGAIIAIMTTSALIILQFIA